MAFGLGRITDRTEKYRRKVGGVAEQDHPFALVIGGKADLCNVSILDKIWTYKDVYKRQPVEVYGQETEQEEDT